MQLTVNPHHLNDAWLGTFDPARVLSLDCFDTLFWRKVIHPTDVFIALEHSPAYQQHGFTARKRTAAEGRARALNALVKGSNEVTLEEIYREMGGGLQAPAIAALIEAEIACEIQFGFIFQPILALIEHARARQMRVVIVSDTYLSSAHLRQLLFGTLPALEGLIDQVFCSADYGRAKGSGIWRDVLAALKVKPAEVLHLGDNYLADLDGPSSFGIAARHLVSFEPAVGAVLTQRQQVAAQIAPRGPTPMLAPQYFHGQLARVETFDAQALGYVSLGPIFYAFARYILGEVQNLEAQGRTVKVAYLLRDGHLPGRACEALAGEPLGSYLNISRFTALAASLDSDKAIITALEKIKGAGNHASALRQLLLPKADIQRLLGQLQAQDGGWPALAKAVLSKDIKAQIFERSKRFRQRLLAHVRQRTGVQPGDTLMFVDLGYGGTAQLTLDRVLRAELGVELVGRYLVANDLAFDDLDKRGLIDPSWADARLIGSLTQYIAALEMMCTADLPSTLDYAADGEPIFDAVHTSKAQSETVREVQDGCLRFISDFVHQADGFKPTLDAQQLRYGAAIDLVRFLYFPVAAELACLEGFKFDSNLGTDWQHPLLDLAAGEQALRRQGLGYIKTNFQSARANVPMELRHTNLALSSLVFSHLRHGFDISPAGLSFRTESVDALVVNGDQFARHSLKGTATYDGFYAVRIPRSARLDISVLLGAHYAWLQIESLQVIDPGLPADAVDLVLNQDVLLEGMAHHGNGLFELDEQGFLYFPRLAGEESNLAYSLVFRPLMAR